MRHHTVEDLRPVAKITTFIPLTTWELRRSRLLRWAQLIEESRTPVRLFHQLEFLEPAHRFGLQSLDSPVSVAFADRDFKVQGIRGDDYASALEFFSVTEHEAHQILCDCHYAGHRPTPGMIASRVRAVANKRPFAERVQKVMSTLRSWL
jgi:hypothetical protein